MKRGVLEALIAILFSLICQLFLTQTSGIVCFFLATIMVVSPIIFFIKVGQLYGQKSGRKVNLNWLKYTATIVTAILFSCLIIEIALQIISRVWNREDGSTAHSALVMPAKWQMREVQVKGSMRSYYWQNVLHVHNKEGMRWIGEFPEKRPETFRIIAIGDSLTYGYGIPQKDTYPSVIEQELAETFRVEVLNLGVSAAESQDILAILQRQFPKLKPDLVVYGMCLNDFLPSGVGQYYNNRAYQVHLPFVKHFETNTLTGKLFSKLYDSFLMKVGLRTDFLGDILRDFNHYQERFTRDVRNMNDFVLEKGLPPIVAMVLDQYPNTKGTSYQVVLAAEAHLKRAGMRVIPSDYILRNNGRRDWNVSLWEGHPNEKANRVFAKEIVQVLKNLPELQTFRIPGK
ncbi:GDSL-type esterase/lipase family protein [bacterium]|nr:GDSL-type esterase/lipase family protein [bacterium]MCI0603345.1 GDSL-type esterase/lipase family protein [bacterium]